MGMDFVRVGDDIIITSVDVRSPPPESIFIFVGGTAVGRFGGTFLLFTGSDIVRWGLSGRD